MVQFDEEKQNARVEELKREEAENLTRVLSEKYELPYLDLALVSVNIDGLRVLKEEQALTANIAVFNIVDKKLHVGVLSPNNKKTQEALADLQKRGYSLIVYLVSPESLKKVWDRYKDLSMSMETRGGALDISNEGILELVEKVTSPDELQKLLQETLPTKKTYRISRLLETILAGALSNKASDIHIEPEEDYVRLRYRLDGVLTDIIRFDNETYNLILSRIKLLSNLKLNTRGKAQDGRFSIKLNDDEIEIRTSLLPGAYNDSMVLRVLNPNAISVPLESLGIHPRLLSILEQEISKPNGMILATGPTGSGKTTTLYACLKKIHSPDIKIITIENPIEYHLPGIVQTQTNDDGYTFLEGLRSVLRQDPDVIMVGEIRDSETAEIAIDAALTGHLVFSTLHTNNAAGAFPRLIDLGVNSKVITSAVSLCIAQRLLRKLCPNCKAQKTPDAGEKIIIDTVISSIQDKSYLEHIDTSIVWEAKGCTQCNFTGYKGRIGVYEAIKTDENIENVVENNPSEREIKKVSMSQNILDMRQDGIIKVLQGITSLNELSRVVDLKEGV